MSIRIIAALSRDGVIGVDNRIPWRNRSDLQRFKEMTTGGIVVMGRKTWDSLPRKPLPGRENWVITRDPEKLKGQRCTAYSDLDDVLGDYFGDTSRTLWVCGGETIYRALLPYAHQMDLSIVNTTVGRGEGTVYFPAWAREDWEVWSTTQHSAEEGDEHGFAHVTLIPKVRPRQFEGDPMWQQKRGNDRGDVSFSR